MCEGGGGRGCTGGRSVELNVVFDCVEMRATAQEVGDREPEGGGKGGDKAH